MQLFRLTVSSSIELQVFGRFWTFAEFFKISYDGRFWHVVYELIRYQNNENEYETYFIYLDNSFKS